MQPKWKNSTIIPVAIPLLLGVSGCADPNMQWWNGFLNPAPTLTQKAVYIDTATGSVKTAQIKVLPKPDQGSDHWVEPTTKADPAPQQEAASPIPIEFEKIREPAKVGKVHKFKNEGTWEADPTKHGTLRKLLFAWSLDAGWKLHWGEGDLNDIDFSYSTKFYLKGDFVTVVQQLLASRKLKPQLVPHFYPANRQLVIRRSKGGA